MIVGVPREIKADENRVAMVPSGVGAFVAHGHTVLVESGAGLGSGLPDAAYRGAGARIVKKAESVWERAEMIVQATHIHSTHRVHGETSIAVATSRQRRIPHYRLNTNFIPTRHCDERSDAAFSSAISAIYFCHRQLPMNTDNQAPPSRVISQRHIIPHPNVIPAQAGISRTTCALTSRNITTQKLQATQPRIARMTRRNPRLSSLRGAKRRGNLIAKTNARFFRLPKGSSEWPQKKHDEKTRFCQNAARKPESVSRQDSEAQTTAGHIC